MTTVTVEPAPPIRRLLVPFVFLCAGVYLLFTALVLQVYVLVPIAAWCFVIGAVPALRLLRHR
jgi:hypothetical protein